MTDLWDRLPAFRDKSSNVPLIHVPYEKSLIQTALRDPDFNVRSPKKAGNYFYTKSLVQIREAVYGRDSRLPARVSVCLGEERRAALGAPCLTVAARAPRFGAWATRRTSTRFRSASPFCRSA